MPSKMPNNGEDLVFQFFKCIEKKDVQSALGLFDDDAVVYEPFSMVGSLHGISNIEPFLKVAVMANSNMRRKIVMDRSLSESGRVSALVTFERGDKTKGRFTFEFGPQDGAMQKIKSLHIRFE